MGKDIIEVMILNILSIIVSALLIGVILMQVSGSGLSSSFGGGGGGEEFRSRRSMEKALVYVTVALAVIFAFISILLLISR